MLGFGTLQTWKMELEDLVFPLQQNTATCFVSFVLACLLYIMSKKLIGRAAKRFSPQAGRLGFISFWCSNGKYPRPSPHQ